MKEQLPELEFQSPLSAPTDENQNGHGLRLKPLNPKLNASSLHQAAREGFINVIRSAVVDEGVPVNSPNDNGHTALHLASQHNRVQIVRALLDFGAKVDAVGPEGLTPLHVASRFDSLEAAEVLLSRGADPCIPASNNAHTPLHAAARFGNAGIVRLIAKKHKRAIDSRDSLGCTALHWACSNGHEEVVQILLNHGSQIDACAREGRTPLHASVAGVDATVLAVLLDEAMKRFLKSPVSVFAPQSSSDNEFKGYVDRRTQFGNTALHVAVQAVNLEAVELLIQNNADINAKTTKLQTPLHVAALCGDKRVVQLLLSKGAAVNTKDEEHKTPLHYAASFGNDAVLTLLLEHKAKVDTEDISGLTPFLCAVISGRVDCGSILLENGADIDTVDNEGRCCLHLAIENEQEEMVCLLLKRTRPELVNLADVGKERTPLHYAASCTNAKVVECLLQGKVNCITKDTHRKTPLHLAVEVGKARIVEMLARAALSAVFDEDDKIRTPLHYASMYKKRKACAILLQFGAEINCSDHNGWTPLMWAAKSGDLATTALLLDKDAPMDNTNTDGNTALHVACYSGHVDVVKLLLDNGASITLNSREMNCLDLAIEQQNRDVIMTIIKHNRWEDIFRVKKPASPNPMTSLIQSFPEAADAVMDRCVHRTAHATKAEGSSRSGASKLSITYNFRYLDPGPDDKSGPDGDRYIALIDMVKYKRQDLLTHPLARKLFNLKWKSFGRRIYFLNFLLYCCFLLCFTIFTWTERAKIHLPRDGFNITAKQTKRMFEHKNRFNTLAPWIIIAFSCFHLLKEVFQLVGQRMRYFEDPTNLLEWCLYCGSAVFALPYVFQHTRLRNNPQIYWESGTVAIFLGFANLILFLRPMSYVGLYVTMYLEVVKTLIKVMCLFVLFILAFSIVFFILFKEQDAFQDFGKSIVTTTVMTIGELDYSTLLVNGLTAKNPNTGASQVPFPHISFLFFYIFLLGMPIVLMNLLIGLAIGDIDSIQQSAFLTNKSMQIDFVSDVERKFPRFITLRCYKAEMTVTNLCGKLKKIFGKYDTSKFEDADNTEEDLMEDINTVRYRELVKEMSKTRQQIKSMAALMERQSDILNALVTKSSITNFTMQKDKPARKK